MHKLVLLTRLFCDNPDRRLSGQELGLLVLYVDTNGTTQYLYDVNLSVQQGEDSDGMDSKDLIQVEYISRGAGLYMASIAVDAFVNTAATPSAMPVEGRNTLLAECFYRGDDLMMPLTMLAELGASTSFDADVGEIVISFFGRELKLELNSVWSMVDGLPAVVRGASGSLLMPERKGNVVAVPLRFTLESLGRKVEWEASGLVSILRQ